MKMFILLFTALSLTVAGCHAQMKGYVNWANVETTEFPVGLIYPESDGVELSRLMNYIDSLPTSTTVDIFGGCGVVSDRYYTGSGLDNTVRFYKRLPNVGECKVVMFAYRNQDDFNSYPAFELQTFDADDRFVDRLVIASSTWGERSWRRSFVCDVNYMITVSDNVTVIDMEDGLNENPEIIYARTTKQTYRINEEGYFVRYYEPRMTSIDMPLQDDWSDNTYPVQREQGEVIDHLREGVWKVIEKRVTEDGTYFVQGVGAYTAGVKTGLWDYYLVSDDFSALGCKELKNDFMKATKTWSPID